MLHSNSLVQVQSLWDKIGVKLVQLLIEKSCEIFWKLIRLLKTGSKSIGESSDVRNMMVLTQLRLILNALFQVDVIIEQPAEHCLLNLLIILLLKEFITKELNRSSNEQLSFS